MHIIISVPSLSICPMSMLFVSEYDTYMLRCDDSEQNKVLEFFDHIRDLLLHPQRFFRNRHKRKRVSSWSRLSSVVTERRHTCSRDIEDKSYHFVVALDLRQHLVSLPQFP